MFQDSEFYTCHLFPALTLRFQRAEHAGWDFAHLALPPAVWLHLSHSSSIISRIKQLWGRVVMTVKWGNLKSENSANAEPGIKSAHNKLVALIIITNCSTADLKDKYRIETLAGSCGRTGLREGVTFWDLVSWLFHQVLLRHLFILVASWILSMLIIAVDN